MAKKRKRRITKGNRIGRNFKEIRNDAMKDIEKAEQMSQEK